jgi:hypothetical protein
MRTTVAYITKSNGAYLINWSSEEAIDRPTDEQYDCAASLATAKRVAVEGARSYGAVGAVRWIQHVPGVWMLDMREQDEDEE